MQKLTARTSAQFIGSMVIVTPKGSGPTTVGKLVSTGPKTFCVVGSQGGPKSTFRLNWNGSTVELAD